MRFLPFAVLLLASSAWAQLRTDVIHTRFEPNVFSIRDPRPLVFQVRVGAANITRVTFCIPCALGLTPVRTELNDQGTNGDKTAGDRIFSATLSVESLQAYLPISYETIGGLVEAFNGATPVVSLGAGVVVLKDAPLVSVTKVNDNLQFSRNVVNMRLTAQEFLGDFQQLQPVTRRFYERYADRFDMLNIIYQGTGFQNRTHTNVQTPVRGIGQSALNLTTQFGSAGRLLGVNRFPVDSLFDVDQGLKGSRGFLHETAHQWVSNLAHPPLAGGRPHWPLSDLATGIMGFSNPVNQQGQGIPGQLNPEGANYRITERFSIPVLTYNDLELYLRGMAPADPSKTHLVFRDQSQTQLNNITNNGLMQGPVGTLTVADIQATEGLRNPDVSAAQKSFRIGTIYLTLDALASAEEMAYFDQAARKMDAAFNYATLGVGHVDAMVEDVPNFPTPSQPEINFVNVAGGGPVISQNAWVEIKGVGLAPANLANGLVWSNAPEFAQGRMPTTLGGISVKINGKPAYVYFVSPNQINVLAPLDSTVGPVQVEVTNGTQVSAPFTVRKLAASPSFFYIGATPYVIATHTDGTLVGPASLSAPGFPVTPARSGETIVIYAPGYGAPVQALVDGSATQSGVLGTRPGISIGTNVTTILFAGVVAPGLYQFNVVMPTVTFTGALGIRVGFGAGAIEGGLGGIALGLINVRP